jgi:hypothetical protein
MKKLIFLLVGLSFILTACDSKDISQDRLEKVALQAEVVIEKRLKDEGFTNPTCKTNTEIFHREDGKYISHMKCDVVEIPAPIKNELEVFRRNRDGKIIWSTM